MTITQTRPSLSPPVDVHPERGYGALVTFERHGDHGWISEGVQHFPLPAATQAAVNNLGDVLIHSRPTCKRRVQIRVTVDAVDRNGRQLTAAFLKTVRGAVRACPPIPGGGGVR
jgi:hypothetical protein